MARPFTHLLTVFFFLVHSFVDSNHRPPTPNKTSPSAVFSPLLDTPRLGPGSITDAGAWTPHYAEDYNIFNSTPGNLQGAQSSSIDIGPATPSGRHKRLLSTGTFAAQIATHVNHLSPDPNLPLPPVEPSRRLASSPNSIIVPCEHIANSDSLPSPNLSNQLQSSKKIRRGEVDGSEPSQTATPPPTGHRGERKLPSKLTMQNDQSFGQPDFTGASQQHDIAAMMAAPDGMFFPLSAPATTPSAFWDPSMGMEFDFSAASPSTVFQTTPAQSHRHTGSFDWHTDIPLFQDPSAPFAPPDQDHMQQMRRDRTFTPKTFGSAAATTAASAAMSAAFSLPVEDPFGIAASGDGINPGMVFGPNQDAFADPNAYIPVTHSGSAEAAIASSGSRTPMVDDMRRSASVKDLRAGKVPDRALAASPVKSNSRPGLGRSFSENRGKRVQHQNRPVLPKLAPAARPASQASNGANTNDPPRPMVRSTGRTSPLKSQHRLASLASIPEAPLQHPRTRTSVRFTIDAHGRARAETTVLSSETDMDGIVRHRQTSRDRSRRSDWGSSDDDSSTDDEPIIIPSRNNSFNASFALPDPLRPVGSIFHSSRRSISDRSTSSFGGLDGPGSHHEGESEAETVMTDRQDKVGDAASELRKVIEDRQKRSGQMGNGRSHRLFQSSSLGSFRGDTASPSNLAESSLMADRQSIRCVCSRKGADGGDSYMVQW